MPLKIRPSSPSSPLVPKGDPSLVLAVDAMGGDVGPAVTVPAVLHFLAENSSCHVLLAGDETSISGVVSSLSADAQSCFNQRVSIVHCSQHVAMDERPSLALRNKRDSSLWKSLQLLAEGKASACVSAGNTGALMAMSLVQLGTLSGISRPAICTRVPTVSGYTYLLDLGANLECSPQQLHEFATMANVIAQGSGKQNPSVGLLNIGIEEVKGSQEIQEAAGLLRDDPYLNYVGFVEGDALYQGVADIVVTDGFTGNVALKTSEGVAKMLRQLFRETLSSNFLVRCSMLLIKPALKQLSDRVDPALYNGASLLGLNAVVIKSHGGASVKSFICALNVAMAEARQGVPQLIERRLSEGADT